MARGIGKQLGRIGVRLLRHLLQGDPRTDPTSPPRRPRRRVDFPFSTGSNASTTTLDPATTSAPGAQSAREYRMPAGGLPPLDYSPRPDGEADPGEVVWAWVPYEDDPSQGKDRPVLIISEVPGGFLGLQMTSKNHSRDRGREAHFGRHWLDIGSGAWDSQGRDSEVRLDRLLFIPPPGVRREGATLPKDRYLEVAEALVALHR